MRKFPSSFRFDLDIVAHNVDGKRKILQYIGDHFFSNFDHFYSSFNLVSYWELKNIKNFEIGQKLTFLDYVFHYNYFFGGRISNFLPGM